MSKKRLWCVAAAALLALGGCDDPVEPVDGGQTDGGGQTMDDGGGQTMDDGGGQDVCEGVADPCTTAGTSCDGTTLVTCEENADGCLVETTMSCSAIGEICDDTGAGAQCIEPVDPCEGVAEEDLCDTEDARACNEDVLEVCAMTDSGCLVLDRTDCGADEGGFCDESGDMPVCIAPPEPCADIPADEQCTAAGTSCDGDSLVTCAPNAFGCLVETATDCSTATDGTCEGTPAMCTFTGDACEGVTECEAAGTFCDGPELVECAPDAFGCLVETRTTCTDAMFGFCDAEAATPACSTAATDPCMGETQCGTEITRACSADNTAVESCVPNAFGCFVEETTACGGSETCEVDDSGVPACAPLDPDCPAAEAMVLDCASGTVNGDTAMGSAIISDYECSVYNYPSNEQIWRFENADRVVVTIAATRGSDSGDYDLYALEGASGAMCDSGLTCLDQATTTSTTEEVEFIAEPGATTYVVYDKFSSSGTTDYTLDITCEPIVCGDGDVVGDETCDDGNATSGDGCSDTCQIEPGYECETAGSACTLLCGNGAVDSGEACDDGNMTDGDGCSASCAVEPDYYCSGEPSTCESMVCGDGNVVGDEECDDANTTAGDGCSGTCEVEDGYECETAGSACTLLCGNGEVDSGEACDDGNMTDGDGCSASCAVEPDYYCSGEPSTCESLVCGDGNVVGDEECDDANTTAGDGCSDTCEIEAGHICDGEGAGSCVEIQHDQCSGARVVSGTVTFTNEPLAEGGARPSGSGCGTGSGSTTLYYEVTIPPNTKVVVDADDGPDTVVMVQNACSDDGCTEYADTPEIVELSNAGSTAITQIVSVRPWSSATTPYDIDFTYVPLTGNALCAGARAVTGTTSFTGEDIDLGGPRPQGTDCGSSDGNSALYYEVTLPPMTSVNVTTSGAFDRVLLVQDSCGATSCSYRTDSSPEKATLTNLDATPITQIVAIHKYDVDDVGTFDIDFTYASLAANAVCAGATALTGSLTGEDLSMGGPRPTGSDCGSSAGPVLYYSVEVPANSTATVTATPSGTTSWNPTLRSLEDCSGDCLGNVNAESSGDPETLDLVNLTGAAVTRLVAVGANSSTTFGTFDIEVTTTAITYASNASCADATPLVAGTALTGEDTAGGGVSPTGAICESSGAQTLYYEVTVPAGQVGTVEVTTSGFDVIVMELDSCGAADCSASVDGYSSGTETLTIGNVGGATDITRVVAVNAYAASGVGTFDIELTLGTPAPGTMCAAAIPVTADVSFTGLNTADGGAPPTGSGCEGASSPSDAFYYAVTIEPGQRATVTLSSGPDLDGTINVIESCGATGCTIGVDDSWSDGGVETIDLDNTTDAPITRYVAVHDWYGDGGSFDVAFAFTPIP